MIIKLIAPNILPGDHVTVDLPTVPRKGDTITVYDKATHIEETLTVHEVVWPITPEPSVAHHAVADMPEVVCDRAEDVGDDRATLTYYDKNWNQVGQERVPATVSYYNPKD